MPDLKRLEKAKPGEHVEVGDKSAARVEETQTCPQRAAAAAAAAAGGGATPSVRMAGGAPAADGMTPSMRLAAGLGGPPGSPKPPADPVKAGGGALMAILIGVGVLVLLAAIGLIVLATKH
ncbi:MAG TPA: hypothetical protein VHF22_13540 [Planctomycetota bacterium]|nr:hypothetical protein [Planctomycetota bacterium]